jgi:hypothetical protein
MRIFLRSFLIFAISPGVISCTAGILCQAVFYRKNCREGERIIGTGIVRNPDFRQGMPGSRSIPARTPAEIPRTLPDFPSDKAFSGEYL